MRDLYSKPVLTDCCLNSNHNAGYMSIMRSVLVFVVGRRRAFITLSRSLLSSSIRCLGPLLGVVVGAADS